MRKYFFWVIISAIILESCATNPYTQAEYNAGIKPLPIPVSVFTSVVPGLTQAINGDYGNAACFASGTAFFVFAAANYEKIYNSSASSYQSDSMPSKESYLLIYGGMAASIEIWNYINGITTTRDRNTSYLMIDESIKKFAKQQEQMKIDADLLQKQATERALAEAKLMEEENKKIGLQLEAKRLANEIAEKEAEKAKAEAQKAEEERVRIKQESWNNKVAKYSDIAKNVGSPVIVEKIDITDASADTVKITFRNISEKVLKYIIFSISATNRVNDYVSMFDPTINSVSYRAIGPFASGDCVEIILKTGWSNGEIVSVLFDSISVINIDNEGYRNDNPIEILNTIIVK